MGLVTSNGGRVFHACTIGIFSKFAATPGRFQALAVNGVHSGIS